MSTIYISDIIYSLKRACDSITLEHCLAFLIIILAYGSAFLYHNYEDIIYEISYYYYGLRNRNREMLWDYKPNAREMLLICHVAGHFTKPVVEKGWTNKFLDSSLNFENFKWELYYERNRAVRKYTSIFKKKKQQYEWFLRIFKSFEKDWQKAAWKIVDEYVANRIESPLDDYNPSHIQMFLKTMTSFEYELSCLLLVAYDPHWGVMDLFKITREEHKKLDFMSNFWEQLKEHPNTKDLDKDVLYKIHQDIYINTIRAFATQLITIKSYFVINNRKLLCFYF